MERTVGDFLRQLRGVVDVDNFGLVLALAHDGYVTVGRSADGNLVWEATPDTRASMARRDAAESQEGDDD
jgi:hypothetical protein